MKKRKSAPSQPSRKPRAFAQSEVENAPQTPLPKRGTRSQASSPVREVGSVAVKKSAKAKVPQPVGDRRQTPLPEAHPKPPQDDPRAAKRLAKIMAGSTYKSAADNDPDFLRHPLTRAVRLQLDYYKPEVLMREYRIEGTIVVFGSTRTPEPKAAKRQLHEALAAWAAHPGSMRLKQELDRAERIVEKSRYYDTARKFGKIVSRYAANKAGPRVVVITGGGPGIMEAANRGAFDAKAPTVGLNITLPHEQYPNSYITPELCFQFHYFAIRKLHFLLRARAMVAFPGGFGTLDELFETLTLMQTRKIKPMPIILVGESFWKKVVDFDFLVEEGVIDPEDKDLFWYAETAEEIWNGILEWYHKKGEPLIGRDPLAAAPVTA
jgi:uncharacterized protein (TIGR00730 family)